MAELKPCPFCGAQQRCAMIAGAGFLFGAAYAISGQNLFSISGKTSLSWHGIGGRRAHEDHRDRNF